MTYEGQGPGPDEIPAPVTTRWSEEPSTSAGDEIPPPFVPARPRSSGPATSEEAPSAPPQSGQDATGAITAAETGSEELRGQEKAFPFEAPWTESPGGEAVPHEPPREAMAPEEVEPTPETVDTAPPEGDFPFDQLASGDEAGLASADRSDLLPGQEETGLAGEPEVEDPAAAEPGPDGWEPEVEDPAAAEPGPDGWEPEVEDPAAAEPGPGGWEPLDTGGEAAAAPPDVPDAAAEVAALLEQMARRLREDGPGAVEREMRSSDRLTSLLAGLVAGYISGRS